MLVHIIHAVISLIGGAAGKEDPFGINEPHIPDPISVLQTRLKHLRSVVANFEQCESARKDALEQARKVAVVFADDVNRKAAADEIIFLLETSGYDWKLIRKQMKQLRYG